MKKYIYSSAFYLVLLCQCSYSSLSEEHSEHLQKRQRATHCAAAADVRPPVASISPLQRVLFAEDPSASLVDSFSRMSIDSRNPFPRRPSLLSQGAHLPLALSRGESHEDLHEGLPLSEEESSLFSVLPDPRLSGRGCSLESSILSQPPAPEAPGFFFENLPEPMAEGFIYRKRSASRQKNSPPKRQEFCSEDLAGNITEIFFRDRNEDKEEAERNKKNALAFPIVSVETLRAANRLPLKQSYSASASPESRRSTKLHQDQSSRTP